MTHGIIPLTKGMFAIVDNDRVSALRKFSWRAVKAHSKYYAKTTIRKHGKDITICMHRFIAQTPFGLICHHENGNSLDNRKVNLTNMEKRAHTITELNNRITRKFEPTPTI